MKYQLKQYNYVGGNTGGSDFMSALNRFCAFEDRPSDIFPGRTDLVLYYIQNEKSYEAGHSYYFCGIIQEVGSLQKINIKLINKDEDQSSPDSKMQFIKTITVPASGNNEYYFLEFIFKPVANFDSILFEIAEEGQIRSHRIGCMDISELNNIIYDENYLNVTGSSLIRFSIQAAPGFLMCLNGEEIRVSRNGIYEVKNGIILINFFTPVTYNTYESTTFTNQKSNYSYNQPCLNTDGYIDRNYRPFTVDYLYYNLEQG